MKTELRENKKREEQNQRADAKRKDFLQYMVKIFPAFLVLVTVTLMTHDSILFAERIGIDTEFSNSSHYL